MRFGTWKGFSVLFFFFKAAFVLLERLLFHTGLNQISRESRRYWIFLELHCMCGFTLGKSVSLWYYVFHTQTGDV